MYTPSAFRQNDLATLHREIRACRLATLVSHGENGLQASHLPLLLRPEQGEYGTLYGHLARANPHARLLAEGGEALVMFSGADAYVSPSWYPAKAEHGKVVPTWNYIAVHAHGRAEVFDDAERLLALLRELTDRHEQPRPQPWAIADAPPDYIDGMLRAIVGFALPIERLEGKWKLGQNRSAADQHGVRSGLAASLDPRDRALAQRMTDR
ncbi:FMN-binding negative transcriptional regulator [Pseudomonas argentinensis]|uniref:Negative transcriptional regulator, PaiB family n=1 Tax=Phytopseudomonas argentinensis TaxID=289370 RepID=A0A1I3GQN2_9GAMM|nr:FMN-binding negative transcriptional regulator [Pseudomonas argentinensis]KAB0548966.1 FMN-binding negative transcriptional regulator [Pseudomonas argentinensis]SFI25622.1 negative transcriptional regulator, PaiB family [Pseudomonas argentinensis]